MKEEEAAKQKAAEAKPASTPDNEGKLQKAALDGDTTAVVALLRAGTLVGVVQWRVHSAVHTPLHYAALKNNKQDITRRTTPT